MSLLPFSKAGVEGLEWAEALAGREEISQAEQSGAFQVFLEVQQLQSKCHFMNFFEFLSDVKVVRPNCQKDVIENLIFYEKKLIFYIALIDPKDFNDIKRYEWQ